MEAKEMLIQYQIKENTNTDHPFLGQQTQNSQPASSNRDSKKTQENLA